MFEYMLGGKPKLAPPPNLLTGTQRVVTSIGGTGQSPSIYNCGMAAWDGKIYIAAGQSTSGTPNDFWSYNLITEVWTKLANFPRVDWDFSMFAADGVIYSFGGLNSYPATTLAAYNIATNTWSANGRPGGGFTGMAVFDSTEGRKGYAGGRINNSTASSTQVRTFLPPNTTNVVNTNTTVGAYSAVTGQLGEYLYTIGGTDNNVLLTSIRRTKIEGVVAPPVTYPISPIITPNSAAYAVIDGILYWYGGTTNLTLSLATLNYFDPRDMSINTIGGTYPHRRQCPGVAYDGKFYVYGGTGSPGTHSDLIEIT